MFARLGRVLDHRIEDLGSIGAWEAWPAYKKRRRVRTMWATNEYDQNSPRISAMNEGTGEGRGKSCVF